MRRIDQELSPELKTLLPETYEILRASSLTVHDAVYGVALEGSRGLRGGFRPDSDLDLSLLVDSRILGATRDKGALLQEVIETTLRNWRSDFEIDTAAVFDKTGCGLKCFDVTHYSELDCDDIQLDCMGVYKTQKGFHGFVPDIGVDVRRVLPTLRIWARSLEVPSPNNTSCDLLVDKPSV